MPDGFTPVSQLIADTGDPFGLCIEHYGMAPNAFAREVLGRFPDPWQEEMGRALAQGHKRLAVRSGHGVGKGYELATIITWFACTRLPFKIGVTAPSASQLTDALMGDVRSCFRSLPPKWAELFDVDIDRIRLKSRPDDCFLTARTSRPDNPESLQGLHSPNLLLVADEASGISDLVYEAAAGSMSTPGSIFICCSNPTRGTGFFWRIFNMERSKWWTRRVECHESPRVDRAFIEEIATRYGEDSNQYRVRVLGEFPFGDDDTLIPADLVDGAMGRQIEPDWSVPEIWGVDVARYGNDDSCLIKRRGKLITEPPRRWHGIDTMQLAGIIRAEYDALQPLQRPGLIAVDVIGLGAGVVDRLMEQNLPVVGVNVGEAPSTTGRFMRMRDQLWFAAREWLEARNVSMPFDDRLRTDLTGPRVSFLSDGRMQVESKAQMRARGLASPDSGDAIVMTFVPAGMSLQLGIGNMMNSRQPVRASIAGME